MKNVIVVGDSGNLNEPGSDLSIGHQRWNLKVVDK